MLRLIGLVFKLGLFSLAVLVLGHLVRWNGKTISDQVKTQMSQAQRSPWVNQVRKIEIPPALRPGKDAPKPQEEEDEIPSSERQKLRALIRELNSSKR